MKQNNAVENSMLDRQCIQFGTCSMSAYDFPLLLAYAPVISPLSMTINSSFAALTERSSPGNMDTPNPVGTVVVRGVKSTDGIDGVMVTPWLGSIKDEESWGKRSAADKIGAWAISDSVRSCAIVLVLARTALSVSVTRWAVAVTVRLDVVEVVPLAFMLSPLMVGLGKELGVVVGVVESVMMVSGAVPAGVSIGMRSNVG